MRRYSLIHQLLRLISLVILPITFILVKVCKSNPQLVDWLYSGKLYPKISSFIAAVTKGLPFSLAEYLLYALIILFAVTLIVRVIGLITFRKNSLMKLISLAITTALTAAYLLFFFYLLWGFNFYRTPIDKRLNLPERDYSKDELYALCIKLADDAAALRVGLPEDSNGVFTRDTNEIFTAVADTYKSYGAEHELFSRSPVKAKRVAWSNLLSRLNITGIFSCYTAEPNVNCEQPSLYTGFCSAHETAHYYGWAKED